MNKNFKIRNTLAGLVLASSGLFTAGASAALVENWDWATDGGFVIAESTCSNGPTQAACDLQHFNDGLTPSSLTGTASIMTWGTGTTELDDGNGEQSALQGVFGASGSGGYNVQDFGAPDPIMIDAFEQIMTNGGWTTIGVGVHYNNVILTTGGHMDSGTLRTTFELTAPDSQGPFPTDIDFTLDETLNVAPCPGLNPEGTVCDDIFTLSSVLPPFAFNYMGVDYVASFQIVGGPGTTVVGGDIIFTAEDKPGVAIFFTQARIDAVPVPGVLALMGMGLVMMGWRARRRKLV